MRRKNQYYEARQNGEGGYRHIKLPDNFIKVYPEGVFEVIGNEFYINDKLVYEGPFDEYAFHKEGVLIRKGKFWHFHKLNPKS